MLLVYGEVATLLPLEQLARVLEKGSRQVSLGRHAVRVSDGLRRDDTRVAYFHHGWPHKETVQLQ